MNLTLTDIGLTGGTVLPSSSLSMTGMCGRGLTCPYQHDSQKISLCPLYLAEKCPFQDAPEVCSLSHDPTPERTPICTRFNTTGDCYKGASCLYPHIRVGSKTGICRDFAVLGYCDKGAMCEASHLRECPDFAETGVCKKMGLKGAAGCKLPHVIRANQQRVGIAKARPQVVSAPAAEASQEQPQQPTSPTMGKRKVESDEATSPGRKKQKRLSPDDEVSGEAAANTESILAGPMEDSNEFISLTFLESDEEEGDEEDDDNEDEEEDGDGSGSGDEGHEHAGAGDDLAIGENDEDDENEVNGELLPSDDVEMHNP